MIDMVPPKADKTITRWLLSQGLQTNSTAAKPQCLYYFLFMAVKVPTRQPLPYQLLPGMVSLYRTSTHGQRFCDRVLAQEIINRLLGNETQFLATRSGTK